MACLKQFYSTHRKPAALLLGLFLAWGCGIGCAHTQSPPAPTSPIKPPIVSNPIITPDISLNGRVTLVNTVFRYVNLNFPTGEMPRLQQTLFLYRGGLKVAEIKVTGPQYQNSIAADLITGEAQIGDIVRAQ
jgi:hypothetical protein